MSLVEVVGARGFEPPTPCSQSRCATRLRYAPEKRKSEIGISKSESNITIHKYPKSSPKSRQNSAFWIHSPEFPLKGGFLLTLIFDLFDNAPAAFQRF
jgi:hypothetical protein